MSTLGAVLLLLLPLYLQDSEITHVSDTIDLSTMPVEDSYAGPRMQGGQQQEQGPVAVIPAVRTNAW